MAEVTVTQFAEVLKVPVERLARCSSTKPASGRRRRRRHQRGREARAADAPAPRTTDATTNGNAAPRKITLQAQVAERAQLSSAARAARRTVNVEVRRKRTYINRERPRRAGSRRAGKNVDAIRTREIERTEDERVARQSEAKRRARRKTRGCGSRRAAPAGRERTQAPSEDARAQRRRGARRARRRAQARARRRSRRRRRPRDKRERPDSVVEGDGSTTRARTPTVRPHRAARRRRGCGAPPQEERRGRGVGRQRERSSRSTPSRRPTAPVVREVEIGRDDHCRRARAAHGRQGDRSHQDAHEDGRDGHDQPGDRPGHCGARRRGDGPQRQVAQGDAIEDADPRDRVEPTSTRRSSRGRRSSRSWATSTTARRRCSTTSAARRSPPARRAASRSTSAPTRSRRRRASHHVPRHAGPRGVHRDARARRAGHGHRRAGRRGRRRRHAADDRGDPARAGGGRADRRRDQQDRQARRGSCSASATSSHAATSIISEELGRRHDVRARLRADRARASTSCSRRSCCRPKCSSSRRRDDGPARWRRARVEHREGPRRRCDGARQARHAACRRRDPRGPGIWPRARDVQRGGRRP